MSDALDEGLVQRIDARGTIEWSETCYRYTGAHRDALSGEGARRFGGRWNPPLLFPAIYLADSAQLFTKNFEPRSWPAWRREGCRCAMVIVRSNSHHL